MTPEILNTEIQETKNLIQKIEDDLKFTQARLLKKQCKLHRLQYELYHLGYQGASKCLTQKNNSARKLCRS
jgi:hypothetical protein